MMSAAKLNLSAIENEIPFKDDMQKEAMLRIIKLVDDSCKEVRAVSHNMMPNALLKAGLASAVREFINQIDQKIIKVNLHSEGLNDRLDINTETCPCHPTGYFADTGRRRN
jgi:signal transduction histidine kinase